MSPCARPEDGDVVIRRLNWEGRIAYLLHTVPGTDQCLLRTREAAVAHAVSFARHQGVRAWMTNDGPGFVLLADARAVEPLWTTQASR